MTRLLTIAIDGPAGAGKSTVARLVARRIGYRYFDSGAMYRAVALMTQREKIPASEVDQIAALARTTPIHFEPADELGEQRILLADEDITAAIRTPEIASLASVVSAIPGVRTALVAQQQEMGAAGGVVMEGRDIGTVVFPRAELKYFLTASPHERAERRHRDLQKRGIGSVSIEEVRADQDERDRRDTTRDISPLQTAEDAFVRITDGLSPDQIADGILEDIRQREHAE
jgi:cytidylate kinase